MNSVHIAEVQPDSSHAATPVEDYELLAREPTSLGAFMRRLNGDLAAAPDDHRRRMLERAREAGLMAYRNRQLSVRGAEEGAA